MPDYFCFQRGCRQGDPIFPYIFIQCAEVLSPMIRKDCIVINYNEFKLSQYADDRQIFLDGTVMSIRKTLQAMQFFVWEERANLSAIIYLKLCGFCSERFPLRLGAWDRLHCSIVALPEPSI